MTEKIIKHKGTVAPIDRANVNTDALMGAQALKSIQRIGFAPDLFDEIAASHRGLPR